jgi:hypothetical protein
LDQVKKARKAKKKLSKDDNSMEHDEFENMDKEERGDKAWKSRQPRSCNHCARVFSNKFNLKQHVLNMHTPGRSVTCTLCDKRVKNKWYLRRHQVTHHNAPLKK